MSYGYGEVRSHRMERLCLSSAQPRPGVPRQVSTPVPATGHGIMKSPSQGALPVTDLSNDAGSPAGASTLSGSGRGPLLVASRPAPSSSLLAAALRAPPPPSSGGDHPKDASAFMAMLKASAAPQPPPSAPTVSQTPPTVSAMPGSPVTPHHAHTTSGGSITAPAAHPPPSPVSASTPGPSSAPGTPQERDDDSPDEEEAAKEPALKPQPGMTQMDKRKLVLLEIVNTERDYLNDLDLIVEMFVKPMTERQLLKPMEIATIFSNVQELIGINKEFLKLLENSRAEVGADMGAMRVAEDFSRMVEPFKRYGRYFADQAFALSTLEKCQASVAPFGQFVQECMMNPRARGLSFFAFLIKPELIKTTPDTHPDYASLLEAAKDIEALVAMLNEKKRATETHQKVLELMTSVEALEQQPAFVKGSSSRYFIFEAEMKVGLGKKGIKMKAYLFNDVLLYHHTKERHKKEEGKRFEFGGVVPINQYTRAVDIADSAEDNNVFALRHAEGTVSFVCNTPEDKKKWIKEVKGRIGDTIKKDLKNRSDTPTRTDTPTRNGRPSTPLSSSTPTLGNTGGASVVDMLFASSSTPVASSPPVRAIPTSGSGASHTWSGSSAPRPTLEKLPSSDAATVSGASGASKQQAISKGESWMDVLSTTGTSAPSSSGTLSPSNSSSALPNSTSAPGAAASPAPLPSPSSLGSSGAGFSSSAFTKPSVRPEALPGAQPGSGSSLPAAFFQGAKPFARGLSNPNFRPSTPTALGASADRTTNPAGAGSNHSPPSSVAPGAPSFLIGTSPPTPEPPAAGTSFVAPATAQEPAPAPIAPSASRDSGAGLLLYTPAGIQGGSNSGASTPTGRGTPTAAGERQTAAALMASLGFPPSAKQSRLRGSVDPEIAASMLGAAPTPAPATAGAAPTPVRDFPRVAPPPVPAEAGTPAPAPAPAPTAAPQREYPRVAPPPAPASDPAPIPVQTPPAALPAPPPTHSPPTQSPPQATPPAVYNPAYPAPASTPPAAVKAGVAKQLVTVVKQPVVAKQQLGSIAPKK